MRKIKILRIIARLNIGGPAIHTILLTQGLDKARFDTLFLCGQVEKEEGSMLYYAKERDVRLIYIPELKRNPFFLKDLIALRKIYDIVKSQKPDIIHTHTAKAGALGRVAGIIYNFINAPIGKPIRLIHSFHGHIFQGYFNKFKSRLFVFIERILAVFTFKIITVSESLKKELISFKIASRDKIEVIPLGLELDKFLNIPFKEDGIFKIGIIGRLVPIKNHRLFLDMASLLIADNRQMSLGFEIVGDGELRQDLEDYSHRLSIASQVSFLGWQRELAKVYSGLDIIALTSINEGTPVSLIEAMASGRLVVATDVGGVKDLLGEEINYLKGQKYNFSILERGIIVKTQDPVSFAASLKFIMREDALRREMGLCARQFVKDKFSKERLIKDVECLYLNILSQGR